MTTLNTIQLDIQLQLSIVNTNRVMASYQCNFINVAFDEGPIRSSVFITLIVNTKLTFVKWMWKLKMYT